MQIKLEHKFLRQDEMNALIDSEVNPITANLMSQAAHILILRAVRKESGPISDFDLRFFMEVIQKFASDHQTLKNSLEGRFGESWFSENAFE